MRVITQPDGQKAASQRTENEEEEAEQEDESSMQVDEIAGCPVTTVPASINVPRPSDSVEKETQLRPRIESSNALPHLDTSPSRKSQQSKSSAAGPATKKLRCSASEKGFAGLMRATQPEEEAALEDMLKRHGLVMNRMIGDGNCLFRAVGTLSGSSSLGWWCCCESCWQTNPLFCQRIRSMVTQRCTTRSEGFVWSTWYIIFFFFFFSVHPALSSLSPNTVVSHFFSKESERDHYSGFVAGNFGEYLAHKRRDKVFGDHLEIQAMAEIYNRPMHIYTASEKGNTYLFTTTIHTHKQWREQRAEIYG